ncbi:hypothetical protein [Fodinicola acaciae]|uniref:hypothetical protein n=1 Tax=Fodinicola acaciae TaxID=2681555 RepID=UPI0013D59EE0|nr:hypothetical protein [Fodinicola acaciae]
MAGVGVSEHQGGIVNRIPPPVTLARVLLLLIALSHVAIPVVMWLRKGEIAQEIAAQHPEVSVAAATTAALVAAAVFHGVLFVVNGWLAWIVPSGRRWTRWVVTGVQVAAVGFGFVSWGSSGMFHLVIPVVDVVAVGVIGLLWLPKGPRGFFARRSADTAAGSG